jgi:YHS domain-containing protein
LTEPIPAQSSEYETACGGKLKDPANYPSAMYQGERAYFCTRACLRVFEQTPDAFIAGEVEHPIDED